MPWGAAIAAGGAIIGSSMAADGATDAASIEAQAEMAGVEEQRRQFDALQKLLKPYVTAGTNVGLKGQRYALNQLRYWGDKGLKQVMRSPLTEGLLGQAEESILQNASATGGLRGGNIQDALARTRTNLLSGLEQQQYGRMTDLYNAYGGLTNLGQSSAAGVGAAGMQLGSNVAGSLGRAGAAQAGGVLAQGNQYGSAISGIGGLLASRLGGGTTTNSAGGGGYGGYDTGAVDLGGSMGDYLASFG